ncbi:MAG: hypothetical protein ACRYHQ_23605 [Janthinobacterium lividum]
MSDFTVAARLLPDVPGWTAGLASLTRGSAGDHLLRTYGKGRTSVFVEVMAGTSAAQVVAQAINAPLGEEMDGRIGSRAWLLRGLRAYLVTDRGAVHSLSVILRGGPGDLPGSVRLEVHGRALRPDDAVTLALALDWDAIVAELAGHHPFDAARVAAASSPPASPPAHQPLLWPMLPSLTSMEQMHRLERRHPPRFAVVNQDAALAMTGHDAHRFAAMPTPVLHVAEPGFAPDLIWAGLHFASAQLRNALGLGPDVVEYRDVEVSGRAVPARTADYKVLRVVHEADPADLARMYGHEPDREADGSPTTAWLLSIAGPHATPTRMIWREGFVPPAPLFRDRNGRLIATEALAERVTRAGITDVVFQDLVSEAALHGLVFRPGSPAHA